MGTPKKLTYGNEGFSEIEDFLSKNKHENYTLSLFDMITNATMEVKCKIDDIPRIVGLVSSAEHDFPAWIGANELSDSYVIGMNFTRGRFPVPSFWEWKGERLERLVSYQTKEE